MFDHVTYRNGPVGSAVCVFSFDHTENDITTVFQGDYLTRTPNNVWSRSTNSRPINVRIESL